MFILVGVSNKFRDRGRVDNCTCPVCGRMGTLHICIQYMTPHVFFIPTFRFGRTYIATCSFCASVMVLDKDKGRALERGRHVQVLPSDLHIMQNNAVPFCSGCGARQQAGNVYCSQCGSKL